MLSTPLVCTALIQCVLVSVIIILLVYVVILVACIVERIQFNALVLNWSTSRFVNYVTCARNCWSKQCPALVRCYRPPFVVILIYYWLLGVMSHLSSCCCGYNSKAKSRNRVWITYYATRGGNRIEMMRERSLVALWVGSVWGVECGEGVEKEWRELELFSRWLKIILICDIICMYVHNIWTTI